MYPEKEAIKLLNELGINKLPVNPVKIIETLGISRVEHNFRSIEGFSVFDFQKNLSFIGVNSEIKELGRKNFTYAHELGHLCLDAFNGNGNSCRKHDVTNNLKGLNQMEINANIFASHLLLPEFLIKNKIKNINPDWKEISNLSKMTETSLITMASRFIEMTDHICLLAIISQDKIIKYFRKSHNWSLYFDMDSRFLASLSYAYKACNQRNIPYDFERVPANIWVSDQRISFDSEILEWSLPLNSYGEVLTLLWDDEDILEQHETEDLLWSPPTF